MTYKLSMICSEQDNGAYFAMCPEIKGCFTQGDTYEEAVTGLKDLVEATIKEEILQGEIPDVLMSKSKIFREFEISV
ncbi:MAG: type II toxin-antitoxin system HicB family antitoxin [Clostridiales bacterium]|nr:type II toxin-antitoxin system HicB family antitoxin [Clostridiales bacterium]